MNIFLFGLPGGWEWIIIVFVVLLLFGGRKIPELMRGIGKGIREFNDARTNLESEMKEGMDEADKEKKNKSINKDKDSDKDEKKE
ncbi:MAG: twin-arginine translocase TatA/TatE family subunit [Chitinophagaceae bacterium]|nr:MAG: twin-arginine translocase TatA/TatE family subunit [Chitinophagaceae bacterium]